MKNTKSSRNPEVVEAAEKERVEISERARSNKNLDQKIKIKGCCRNQLLQALLARMPQR
jgi:hypothetical protein